MCYQVFTSYDLLCIVQIIHLSIPITQMNNLVILGTKYTNNATLQLGGQVGMRLWQWVLGDLICTSRRSIDFN